MNHTLVARAIVQSEIIRLLGEEGLPLSRLTVSSIVKRYGLNWGRYVEGDERHLSKPVANQFIRNALNEAFQRGALAKLYDTQRQKYVRDNGQLVYVDALVKATSWGTGVKSHKYNEPLPTADPPVPDWSEYGPWGAYMGMHLG